MKVCFVGIGSIAKRHIRNLKELCEEQGLAIKIDALRRSEAVAFNVPEGVDDIYTNVNHLPKDYDVIFLTNPTEYHADMLINLHNHGKHFFIEKPVASLGTMEKLEKISYRKDSVYYVACPLRYTNVIQHLKDEIEVNMDSNSVEAVSAVQVICRIGVQE